MTHIADTSTAGRVKMDSHLLWCLVRLFIFTVLLKRAYAAAEVKTELGVITGVKKNVNFKGEEYKVNRYLGIPYAKPPLGDRRFKKPEPFGKFESSFDATSFGASCPQMDFAGFKAPDPMSEECLFLNVYVPDSQPDIQTGHAVMVFIHGGGFTMGTSTMYVSDTLAAFGNVIVVTINYRVGIWGFLSTHDEHAPGNIGLWDQHLAFQWVHNHIGAFGGDADRVTIFGESAGAASVSLQMLYPGNKGLFQRAIMESGSAAITACYSRDISIPTKLTAEQLNCSTESSKEMVSCLRQKNTDEIISVMTKILEDPEKAMKISFMPIKDNDFISYTFAPNDEPSDDRRDFLQSIDLLNGVNSDEGAISVAYMTGSDGSGEFKPTSDEMKQNYVPMTAWLMLGPGTHPAVVDMISSEYTDWENPDDPDRIRLQYVKMTGDTMFNVPSTKLSFIHANFSKEVNSYAYQFRCKPTTSIIATPDWVKRANHGDELRYVFGLDKEMVFKVVDMVGKEMKEFEDWEFDVAYNVMTYWTNFAKSGNPNKPNPVVATWPKYRLKEQQYIILDKDMSPDTATGNFFYARELNFWDKTIPSVVDAIAHAHDESSPFSKNKGNGGSCGADGDCGGQ